MQILLPDTTECGCQKFLYRKRHGGQWVRTQILYTLQLFINL